MNTLKTCSYSHQRTLPRVCLSTFGGHASVFAGPLRHCSFMHYFKKICGPRKQTPSVQWKYGTELLETNYPILFYRMVLFC